MIFRKSAAIMAIAGTMVLGTAAAALADSGSGTRVAVSGSACVGSVAVDPQQGVLQTGSAVQTGTSNPTSVRWSIWVNSTPDLGTATRVIKTEGSSVVQGVQNTSSSVLYYWGCLFNNSTVKVDYSMSINPVNP